MLLGKSLHREITIFKLVVANKRQCQQCTMVIKHLIWQFERPYPWDIKVQSDSCMYQVQQPPIYESWHASGLFPCRWG